jgi:hypothetical protein
MQRLFFKQAYVESILSKEKRCTARARRVPVEPGARMIACVGLSRPFAILRVLDQSYVPVASLEAGQRKELRRLYPRCTMVWLLTYCLESGWPPPD